MESVKKICFPTKKRKPSEKSVPFKDFFGEMGSSEAVYHQHCLPTCYIGTNKFLATHLINEIFKAPTFTTSTLLPMAMAPELGGIVLSTDKNYIIWNEFNFVCQLCSPMPAGVSFLVSQLVSELKDHMVRYGLCLTLNHGFALTECGVQSYQENLGHIRDASVEALHVDVIEALLACDEDAEMALTLEERSYLDRKRFAEVQKAPGGWKALDARARRTPCLDTWVLDVCVGDFSALSAGVQTFTINPVKMPGHDDPVNILSRRRVIGEYTTSYGLTQQGRYASSFRDIMIYDDSQTCPIHIKLSEGLAHCMRFDSTGKLAAHGFTPGNHRDGSDMFFTPEFPDGVNYFFEMDEVAMPQQAIEDWTAGVIMQFGIGPLVELQQDLKALEDLVEKGRPSYRAICKLAECSDTQLEDSNQAKKAVRAMKTLSEKLDKVCFGNVVTEEALFTNAFQPMSAVRPPYQRKASTLELIIGTAFLNNAVHEATLSRFLDTGCVFPFNMVYARPYQTYDMSAGICMKAGNSTGETFVRPEGTQFMLTDNTEEKQHIGTFHLHSKPIVHNKQQVFVARDMFCSAYCGGAGTEFFVSKFEHDSKHTSNKSLFALLVPYKLYDSEVCTIAIELSESVLPTYASSDFYRKYWDWTVKTSNTVCFQGRQNMYNSLTKLYDITIQNQGHWST